MKLLLPFTWTVWGASLLTLVYWLHRLAAASATGFYTLRELLVCLLGAAILVELLSGAALFWAPQRLSFVGISLIAFFCSVPLAFLLTTRAVDALARDASARNRQQPTAASPEGDFPDPALRPIAAAIAAGDPVALKQTLPRPVPAGKDRAGYDLLNYALRRYRFENGSLECIRILLATGADPNSPDPITGNPPLIELGEDPAAVRAFVEAGANLDTNTTGLTPVVRFTMLRNWESAIYLVQHGANLETRDEQGISLDYFLKTWSSNVNGEHPEGWDRLRAAIKTARRANPSAAARPAHP